MCTTYTVRIEVSLSLGACVRHNHHTLHEQIINERCSQFAFIHYMLYVSMNSVCLQAAMPFSPFSIDHGYENMLCFDKEAHMAMHMMMMMMMYYYVCIYQWRITTENLSRPPRGLRLSSLFLGAPEAC